MTVLELPTDRRLHVAQYARGALVAASALGKIPTPLDDVTAALKLHAPEDLFDLGEDMPPDLRARVMRFKGKVLGALAIGERKIYIDMQQDLPRRRFTHGHEIGHDVLCWHAECYYSDDKTTLRPDTSDELEAEANAFSAALLFNLDQFTEQAHAYQPGLVVPLALADVFQTSRHAAIREYVENAPRPAALLTLGKFLNYPGGRAAMVVRQSIESQTFRRKYGPISTCLPALLPLDEYELARDAKAALRGENTDVVTAGHLVIVGSAGTARMDYEIFFNRYQIFVLLVPSKIRLLKPRLSAEWSLSSGK